MILIDHVLFVVTSSDFLELECNPYDFSIQETAFDALPLMSIDMNLKNGSVMYPSLDLVESTPLEGDDLVA